MTQISDATLMAYVDGELDAAARSEVQRAIAADAVLAERVREQTALRARLQAAFAPPLDEPLPERLLQALQSAPAPAPAAAAPRPVIDLGSAREARDARRAQGARTGMQGWAAWGGIAASLLVGVMIGKLTPSGGDTVAFETQGGRLVARGAVEQALSTQLASAPAADAAVAVQLSFIDKAGYYCRTFSTTATAGLACRDGTRWLLQQAAAIDAAPGGAMRQAASALPATILDAVDQRIDGTPLDAAAEQAALRGGWQR